MTVEVENCEARLLFVPDVGPEALVSVLEHWAQLPEVTVTAPIDDLSAAVREEDALRVTVEYGSVGVSLGINEERPPEVPDVPTLALFLDGTYVRPEADDETIAEHVSDFADCLVDLYSAAVDADAPPTYVLGADQNQRLALLGENGAVATTRAGVHDGRVEQLYWLQILPPGMVESVGRETLLSAPAWRVEELDDGAVLFASYPYPHFPENESAIEEHVGVELPIYWI